MKPTAFWACESPTEAAASRRSTVCCEVSSPVCVSPIEDWVFAHGAPRRRIHDAGDRLDREAERDQAVLDHVFRDAVDLRHRLAPQHRLVDDAARPGGGERSHLRSAGESQHARLRKVGEGARWEAAEIGAEIVDDAAIANGAPVDLLERQLAEILVRGREVEVRHQRRAVPGTCRPPVEATTSARTRVSICRISSPSTSRLCNRPA